MSLGTVDSNALLLFHQHLNCVSGYSLDSNALLLFILGEA